MQLNFPYLIFYVYLRKFTMVLYSPYAKKCYKSFEKNQKEKYWWQDDNLNKKDI